MKTCVQCGKEFAESHGRQKICSSACRRERTHHYYQMRVADRKPKTCGVCGEEIVDRSYAADFCLECSRRRNNDRARERQKERYSTDKEYRERCREWHRERDRERTAIDPEYVRAKRERERKRREKTREAKPAKPCAVCGAAFVPRNRTYVVCSAECRKVRDRDHARRYARQKDRKPPTCKTCPVCGGEFPANRNQVYCSKACRNAETNRRQREKYAADKAYRERMLGMQAARRDASFYDRRQVRRRRVRWQEATAAKRRIALSFALKVASLKQGDDGGDESRTGTRAT